MKGVEPSNRIYDYPIYVKKVHFDGLDRTKRSALDALSKHLFKARTLRQLVHECYAIKQFSEDVGLFRKVDVSIEPSERHYNGVEVVYSVREAARLKVLADGTVDQNGQLNTGLQLSSLSVSGRGDSVKASLSLGRENASIFDLRYSIPWLSRPGSHAGADLFRQYCLMPQCNAVSLESGIGADVCLQISPKVSYSARLLDCWRFFNTSSKHFMIREHAGHSVKVSFEHSMQYNTEDDKILPNAGCLLSFAQEFAGLWGDVEFTKYKMDCKKHFRLPYDLFASFGLSLVHISTEAKKGLSFVDKTFIGGPYNLRGFSPNSVGKCITDGTCLGGTGSACFVSHLYRPLLGQYLYGHAFLCTGTIWRTPYSNPVTTAWRKLNSDHRRTSVGLGLLLKVANNVRIEANYCWPINVQQNDKARRGFQFGIGASFL